MKLDKKGFTLIELLAVVVILLLISVIAISSISAAIERNKAKQDNTKKEIFVSYAKLYYDKHKNTLTNPNSGCISLDDLDLTEDERTDANGEPFDGGVRYNNGTFTYDETCS